jgi:hypothetical protein
VITVPMPAAGGRVNKDRSITVQFFADAASQQQCVVPPDSFFPWTVCVMKYVSPTEEEALDCSSTAPSGFMDSLQLPGSFLKIGDRVRIKVYSNLVNKPACVVYSSGYVTIAVQGYDFL